MNKNDDLKEQLEEIKKEYSSAADIILKDEEEKSSKIIVYSTIFFILIFIILFYFLSPSTRKVLFHRFSKIGEIGYEKPKFNTLRIKVKNENKTKEEKSKEMRSENELNFSKNKNGGGIKKKNTGEIKKVAFSKPLLRKRVKKRRKNLSKEDMAINLLEELKPRLKSIITGKSEEYNFKGFSVLKRNGDVLIIDLKIEIVKDENIKHLIWKVDLMNKKVYPIGYDTVNFEINGHF